jgi:hypothetical protein
MSNVGAWTFGKASPARSGRPPRETTAATSCESSAAATSAAGARAEISDALISDFLLFPSPLGSVHKTLGEQTDVESVFASVDVERFLFRREQVEK